MSVLTNAKHERFAQELAQGVSATEAHVKAGYKRDDGNASKLASRPEIQARVQEITGAAAEKAGVTVERVLTELGKIAFSDIRKAIDWRGSLVREQDNPDGVEVLVIKEIVTNHVRLIDADKLDDETAGAIAEVKQNVGGGISLKLHDKQAALVSIGKHLGMFKERVEHDMAPGLAERLNAALKRIGG